MPSDDDHLFFPILSIDWHFIDDFASLSFPFLFFSLSLSFDVSLLSGTLVLSFGVSIVSSFVQFDRPAVEMREEQMEHVAPCSTLRNGN